MALTDIEQVRLLIGDTEEPYFLADDQIQFYLDSNNGDIPSTVDDLRPVMLTIMSATLAREREGQVEVYQGDRARNYLEAFKYLDSSNRTGVGTSSIVVMGTQKTFNDKVKNNTNSVGAGVAVGMFSGNTLDLFS